MRTPRRILSAQSSHLFQLEKVIQIDTMHPPTPKAVKRLDKFIEGGAKSEIAFKLSGLLYIVLNDK